MSLPAVVVVNTIRRPLVYVEKSLRNILNQKFAPQKLILIDQNPEPLPLSQELLSSPLLEVQRAMVPSVSAARNSVQLPDDCEWICFCDDDGYWDRDYSEKLQLVLKQDHLDLIAGSILREDNLDFYSLRQRLGGNLMKFQNLKLLMGSNFIVRRALFENVSRFDTRFGAGSTWGSSEETDFAWKCYFSDARMAYQADLRVIHVAPFNENFRLGFRKAHRYAIGKGALVAKWLWEEKKVEVLHELGEMLIIPIIQITRGVLTLKISLAANNFGVFWGRLQGFVSFTVQKILGKL